MSTSHAVGASLPVNTGCTPRRCANAVRQLANALTPAR